MENNRTNIALPEDIVPEKAGKRVYHTPEFTLHGELVALTAGASGSFSDVGAYTSLLD